MADPAGGVPVRPGPDGGERRGRAGRGVLGDRRVRLFAATGSTVALILSLWLLSGLVPPLLGGSGGGGSPPAPPGPAPFDCSGLTGPAPGSLVISARAPTSASLPPGSDVSVSYELSAVQLPSGSASVPVAVPSIFAVFPLVSNGTLSVYLAPRSLSVGLGAWTPPAQATASRPITTALTFDANASPFLTTQRLGLMAPEPYGTIEVAVRWQWTVTPAGGAPEPGGWTSPSVGGPYPSVLFPAPQVTLLGTAGTTLTTGSNFTAFLDGAIGATNFTLKLENASTGRNLEAVTLATPPGNATPLSASIPMVSTVGPLVPGNYLVHVHNACGVILYSIGVRLSYPASANVTVGIAPSSCGPVLVNGTTLRNGQSAELAPSSGSYGLSAPSCGNLSFAGWSTSGGLYVGAPGSPSTTLDVSSSGTLSARYA